ncbi:DUF5996 family protein [Caulobacter sp. 17J65-9]|uniref:DUF5996 family protein n=1 Tax=Caulobacter sp. 17J65-9 TaxID=2709382 RepID=UPI0013C99272|nr:DUF5996 family protein [Caulobacter sp. 17J65-9]NEX93761.1 hypothetical protein [Caulobacter sp. 17J65-9]
MARLARDPAAWPQLRYADWADTIETLHMWTQVVGKVRLAYAAPVNHWWHVTLYPDERGLTTGPMPCGDRWFEVTFDFVEHRLVARTDAGEEWSKPLKPRTVADFYAKLMKGLRGLGLEPHVWTTPCEIPNPIPFEKDELHRAYDPAAAERYHRVLLGAKRVMDRFRGEFLGKASPTHFFWGGFDLASTRFSGRTAPHHGPVPNTPDRIVQEAYSHECYSAGFWPGAPGAEAMFYAYAYPEPAGFNMADVQPEGARYETSLGEFVLPYETLRAAPDPDAALLAFLQSTYDAAAELGDWDRTALERQAHIPPPSERATPRLNA